MSAKIDKKAGSISYNRLDMQLSQALHFAIELYDSMDFLLILDYYDDITLFENENDEGIVSYYQMKTSDDTITLHTVLSEEWLDKLYAHIFEPNKIIKELGIITNCNIKTDNQILSAERTPFNTLKEENINKIKKDIALKNKIEERDVDLSKFIHLKTTLSIDRHKDIVQQELTDFLFSKYPKIKVQVIKTIFNSIYLILSKRQGYERLSENSTFEEAKSKKGFAKSVMDTVIKMSIKISIPDYDELRQFLNAYDEVDREVSFAYTAILTDSNSNSTNFLHAFEKVDKIIDNNPKNQNESIWDYIARCKNIFSIENSKSTYLYSDRLYIEILAACILMNKE